jgi:hypothetical protein
MTDPKPEQAEPGTVVEAAVDPDSIGAEPVAETGAGSAEAQATEAGPSTGTDTPGRAG